MSATRDAETQRVIQIFKHEVGGTFTKGYLEKLAGLLGLSEAEKRNVLAAVPSGGDDRIDVETFARWVFRDREVFEQIAAGGYGSAGLGRRVVGTWGDLPGGDMPERAKRGCQRVAFGFEHGVALCEGQVIVWGTGEGAQEAPHMGGAVVDIGCGRDHNAALTSDGKVVVWGSNRFNQRAVPELQGGDAYTAIAVGAYHTVALTKFGSLLAWGLDSFGQCSKKPVTTAGDTWIGIAAGYGFSMARSSNGRIACWGDDAFGQVTRAPKGGAKFRRIAAGMHHCVALTEQGRIEVWGCTALGQKTNVPTGNFSEIAAGQVHTVALDHSGRAHAFGANDHGQRHCL